MDDLTPPHWGSDAPNTPISQPDPTGPVSEGVLLPCPVCGGNDAEISWYARGDTADKAGYFVECGGCSASGEGFDIEGEAPDRDEYTQGKAITAWNTRLASPINSADRQNRSTSSASPTPRGEVG